MSATSKIAAGVAAGYFLGRTKKFKLAITVGSMLAGKRLTTNPQALLAQGSDLIEKNPELKKLQDQITGSSPTPSGQPRDHRHLASRAADQLPA